MGRENHERLEIRELIVPNEGRTGKSRGGLRGRVKRVFEQRASTFIVHLFFMMDYISKNKQKPEGVIVIFHP